MLIGLFGPVTAVCLIFLRKTARYSLWSFSVGRSSMHTGAGSDSRTPHRQTRIKLLDPSRLWVDRRGFRGFDHGRLQGRKGGWREATRTLAAGLASFDGRALACIYRSFASQQHWSLPKGAQWLQLHVVVPLLLLDVALLIYRERRSRESLPLDSFIL